MALTQGAWVRSTVDGHFVAYCDIVQTAAETDAYTLKTPEGLDTSKPFFLLANAAAATLDGVALAVDIWAGYSANFVLSGQGANVVATDGVQVFNGAIDDVKGTAISVLIDPNFQNTAVPSTLAGVRGVVNCGSPISFAFNLDGGSTLSPATCRWVIFQ